MWKSAGRAPSLRVLPWHLPYKWGKSTEKNVSQGNLHSCNCNTSAVLYPDIFKTLVSWAEKFSATFSSKLIFEMWHFRNKVAAQQCIWVKELHHWWAEMHLPAINPMIHGFILSMRLGEAQGQSGRSTRQNNFLCPKRKKLFPLSFKQQPDRSTDWATLKRLLYERKGY